MFISRIIRGLLSNAVMGGGLLAFLSFSGKNIRSLPTDHHPLLYLRKEVIGCDFYPILTLTSMLD